jgi:hypothetical protein
MELGGRLQVAAYNAGVVAALLALAGVGPVAPLAAVAWVAAAWALVKTWAFPRLAALPRVQEQAARWWAPPEA